MSGHSVVVLRALGWALLACGVIGLCAYTADEQPALAIASTVGGMASWATFTTAADFVERVAARLERIEANTKRMADALEQGLR